jgi:hypothetical protein
MVRISAKEKAKIMNGKIIEQSNENIGNRPWAASVLPLPKGVGWGEGEGIVRQPIVHLIQPSLHERGHAVRGRRSVVSERGLAVSNRQIGYLAGAHRLQGTYRISSQLQ